MRSSSLALIVHLLLYSSLAVGQLDPDDCQTLKDSLDDGCSIAGIASSAVGVGCPISVGSLLDVVNTFSSLASTATSNIAGNSHSTLQEFENTLYIGGLIVAGLVTLPEDASLYAGYCALSAAATFPLAALSTACSIIQNGPENDWFDSCGQNASCTSDSSSYVPCATYSVVSVREEYAAWPTPSLRSAHNPRTRKARPRQDGNMCDNVLSALGDGFEYSYYASLVTSVCSGIADSGSELAPGLLNTTGVPSDTQSLFEQLCDDTGFQGFLNNTVSYVSSVLALEGSCLCPYSGPPTCSNATAT